jgi:hypothetical protein
MLGILLATKVLQGVGPQQVAHGTERGGLLESVQLKHKNKLLYRHSENVCVRMMMLLIEGFFSFLLSYLGFGFKRKDQDLFPIMVPDPGLHYRNSDNVCVLMMIILI